MGLCRESKTERAYSYGMKHRAEYWARSYIANGSMTAAALMTGAAIRRESHQSPNANIMVEEPRRCWRNATCRGLINREKWERIYEECRSKYEAGPETFRNAILTREEFWIWVGRRKAGDDPRGDFVRDTRELLRSDIDPGRELISGCLEAMKQHDHLWQRYCKEKRVPDSTVRLYADEPDSEEDYCEL